MSEAPSNPTSNANNSASTTPSAAPIIVKKITAGHHGAHGGAWKIALADMMTAMMAFFLLMWIMGATNTDKRKSVADFFRPSVSHSLVELGKSAGSGGLLGGQSIINPDAMPFSPKQTGLLALVTPRSEGGPTENEPSDASGSGELDVKGDQGRHKDSERHEFDKLESDIKKKFLQDRQLAALKDQVQFFRDKDGFRIQILDKADFSMFSSGTARFLPRAQALMESVALSLASMPNKLVVRGHTDSSLFSPKTNRSNWSLSAERAEATRVVLEEKGVSAERFVRIEGVADTLPLNEQNRFDPRNRRMSITVLY